MASDPAAPAASIVVPTRERLGYLRVALASLAPQAREAGAEVLVIDDAGASEEAERTVEGFSAHYVPLPRPLGLNAARNAGVKRSSGELVVFVDDDVEVQPGWLAALLAAARAHPDIDVFTGPIRARLEGSPPRSCGREAPPITALELGGEDTPTRYAWGANMAIRRAALERGGPFDTRLQNAGDEQDWQERAGTHALYVAGAALDHRRYASDSSLRALCRAAFARGRAARRFDAWRGEAPSLWQELRTLAGCLGHVLVRRCPAGLTMAAHSAGRAWGCIDSLGGPRARARLLNKLGVLSKARARASHPESEQKAPRAGEPASAAPTDLADPAHSDLPPPAPSDANGRPGAPEDDFLSGESGTIGGLDSLQRRVVDMADDTLDLLSGRRLRLDRAAHRTPPTRRVLALCVERPQQGERVAAIGAELARSRHDVELCRAPARAQGKFENLNGLLAAHDPGDRDWLLVLDDDIALPRGFLDRFLLLAERFSLDLAQPAHRAASHAAWRVTRRQRGSLVRETPFVEIGPVTAFARSTFATLLPFPELRMGWGLDLHWAALAREHGWRCGVLDAVPIAHRDAPTASDYSREQALAEARAFLHDRPHLSAAEAQQTLATHRRL